MGSEDNACEYVNTAWSFYTDTVDTYAYWDDAFTIDECDKIITVGKQLKMSSGAVGTGKKLYSPHRKSEIVFLNSTDLEWAYQRLTYIALELNSKFFNFDLWGFGEGLQFTEYKAPHAKYDAHIDKSTGSIIRKLSIVVQLTNPKDYLGGDLEILNDGEKKPLKLTRKQGAIIVFPSYTLHRVTTVTEGIRHSLVGWISGKPFK